MPKEQKREGNQNQKIHDPHLLHQRHANATISLFSPSNPLFPSMLRSTTHRRRPADFLRVAPVRVDRGGRALVRLAAADGVPGAGEDDAGDEDDGRVVHALERDGDGRGHAEERDGEHNPGWKEEW